MSDLTTMETSEGVTVFIGPPGSGKTEAMLRWMDSAPEGVVRVLVSPTGAQAMQTWRRVCKKRELRESNPDVWAPETLNSWQFIGWQELPSYQPYPVRTRQAYPEFGFDNVFSTLGNMVRRNISAMSFRS